VRRNVSSSTTEMRAEQFGCDGHHAGSLECIRRKATARSDAWMGGHALLLFAAYEKLKCQFGGVCGSFTVEGSRCAARRRNTLWAWCYHPVLCWGDVRLSLRQSRALARHSTPIRPHRWADLFERELQLFEAFWIARYGMITRCRGLVELSPGTPFLKTRGELPPFASRMPPGV
jgi:hypothetical protein